jgi:hypothetical protein
MPNIIDTELAWMAGFFDGEGCIRLSKLKRYGNRQGIHYGRGVTISNTDRDSLEIFKLYFGGSIQLHTKQSLKHKTAYKWVACSRMADNFIDKVYPYLKLKRNRADLFIKFKNLFCKEGLDLKENDYTERNELVEQMHIANFRGVRI